MKTILGWALPIFVWSLTSGCAYEFSHRYVVEHVRFSRNVTNAIDDFHDLEKVEKGESLMLIFRDQVPGYTVGAMNTVKFGIEIAGGYTVGVPIEVDSPRVTVRFSDLDGNPPRDGIIGTEATGIVTILSMNKKGCVVLIDIAILASGIMQGGQEEVTIDDRFGCRWLEPDPDLLPPYLGGTLEDPRNRPSPSPKNE
ncbi:MAG: hypothetical protein O7H41_08890 [Planctomycetota bacterium]|nr:hypothetical protein [Planctomycetota bacterium]